MNDKFRVLVINVCLRPKSDKYIFPIGLGYIATAMDNAGFNFKILDLDALRLTDKQIEEKIKNSKMDAVAMGCIVTGYKFVKKYCEMIKKYHDVPIIVGNSVATSIPNILMGNTKADIGVMGEGDITIVELLNAIKNNTPLEDVKGIFFKKNGKLVYTPPRDLIESLDTLPFINYELFDIGLYLRKCKNLVPEPYPIEYDKIIALPLNTARGCPFSCTFCYHIFRGLKFRRRSVKHLGEEIKLLKEKYNVNYLLLSDELSLFSRKQANEFADYLIDNDINVYWSGTCRAGLFREEDLELAKKLRRAGCVDMQFSLESADEDILKAMNKNITIKQFKIQTRVLQKAGINASTSLVIGYPQETLKTLQKTFDICYNCEIYPSSGYLLPQPGTEMYDYAIENGFIEDEEKYILTMGDRQDFRINLTKIKQEDIENSVKMNLIRISDKLNLGLADEQLIKTGHYRQKDIEINKSKN